MSFWDNLKLKAMQFMQGRYGTDELGLAGLILTVVLSMLDNYLLHTNLLSLLTLVLYPLLIYRMFSRDIAKRAHENQVYKQFFATAVTKVRQFIMRVKLSREYKYFRCPGCRSLMRMKRGTGSKHFVCPKCHHEFDQKA